MAIFTRVRTTGENGRDKTRGRDPAEREAIRPPFWSKRAQTINKKFRVLYRVNSRRRTEKKGRAIPRRASNTARVREGTRDHRRAGLVLLALPGKKEGVEAVERPGRPRAGGQ